MSGMVELQRDPERGVVVGCTFRSIRSLPRQRAQAFCSCGWEGPRRRKTEKAVEDRDGHELDLIPAVATPGIVRTGGHVRVFEDVSGDGELGSFRTGRYVGFGPDAHDLTPLLFVQIGAGLMAFPAATTVLQAATQPPASPEKGSGR